MRLLFTFLLFVNLLQAGEKFALLIGNSHYRNLGVLSSPEQDIPALATKLSNMGFKVTPLYDLDEKAMKTAIKNFKIQLNQHPNSIALFYYSGHGSQAYGESYLIPIDGDTRDEADVEADGVKVETIAKKMANARTDANILFLDACRDVPTGTMGDGTKGLANVNRQPSSTLILYSTSKNKTAKDDRVFNQTVLEKLALNMPFSSLANDISYDVGQKTSQQQVPEILSTGLPKLCLSGTCQQQEVKVIEKIVYRDRPQTPQPIATPETTHPNITKIGNLMYQNQPFTKDYTWKEAKAYCSELTLGGYSDWRLPNREELMKLGNIKLYNYDNYDNWKKWFEENKNKRLENSKGEYHFIRKEFVENMPEYSWFWTSEEKDSSNAWYVNFRLGNDIWDTKSNSDYALCVR